MSTRIAHAELKQFKGGTRSFDLSPVTVVVGANFAGKTALADALQIGLLGYHPRVGKNNAALFKFSGGPSMSIRLVFENGVENVVTVSESVGKISSESTLGAKTSAVLLDVQEYFRLTSAQRIKYVFDKADLSAFSKEQLITEIDALEVVPTNLTRMHVARAVEQIRGTSASSVQEWMDSLVQSFTGELKDAKQKLKAASAQLGSLKHNGAVPKDVSKEIEKAKETLKTLLAAKTSYEEALAARDRKAQDVANAKATLATFADTEKKLAETDQKIATVPVFKPTAEFKVKLSALKKQVNDSTAKLQTSTNTLNSKKARLESLKQQIGEVSKMDLCLGCRAKMINKMAPDRDALQTEIEQLSSSHDSLSKTDAALATRCTEFEAQCKQALEAEQQKQSLTELRQSLVTALGSRDRLQAQAAETVPPLPVADPLMTQRIQTAEEFIKNLQDSNTEWAVYQDLRQRRQNTEADLLRQQARQDSVQAILEVVTRVQNEVVERVFGTLLQKARMFTDGILLSPLVYQGGELGRIQDGVFVSHETFSGVESLLSYAGLSVALATESQCKLVVLDELGRARPEIKRMIVSRLIELASSGAIDQAICIDVTDEPYVEYSDVEIIRL